MAASTSYGLVLVVMLLSLSHFSPLAAAKYFDRKRSCTSQPRLVCVVQSTLGNTVKGNITFAPTFKYDSRRGRSGYHVCMVEVKARLIDISPGLHGFHVHTYGDLRDFSGASTGGHFTNPEGDDIPHGFPDESQRHWGDFGNIEADSNGVAEFYHVDRLAKIPAILGRAITIHADADKGSGFQPTGASGSRIGFCVIGLANTLTYPN